MKKFQESNNVTNWRHWQSFMCVPFDLINISMGIIVQVCIRGSTCRKKWHYYLLMRFSSQNLKNARSFWPLLLTLNIVMKSREKNYNSTIFLITFTSVCFGSCFWFTWFILFWPKTMIFLFFLRFNHFLIEDF